MDRSTLLLMAPDTVRWAGVRALLQGASDVCVLADLEGVADAQALRASEVEPPQVILGASELGRGTTLPVLMDLRRRWPQAGVLLLTDYEQRSHLTGFLRLPRTGCIHWKDLTASVLLHSLLALSSGSVTIVSDAVHGAISPQPAGTVHGVEQILPVSPRGMDVLNDLAEGHTEDQIALRRGLSRRTVQRTISDLQARLGAPSLFALGLAAERYGLLESASLTSGDSPSPATYSAAGAYTTVRAT
jgi:DNA-binding NarL/FixJ family response regulator